MNTCTKVFLRKKAISGGRISLYLDFYPAIRNPHTNRMSRRETLGIYIYASPKNEREKQFNASMEEKAEAIRCRRFEQLLNEQFDFLDKEKLRMDFLAYFKQKCRQKYQKWDCVLRHFTIYRSVRSRINGSYSEFITGMEKEILSGSDEQRDSIKTETVKREETGIPFRNFQPHDHWKPEPPKPKTEKPDPQKEAEIDRFPLPHQRKSRLTPGEIQAIKDMRASPNIPEDAKPELPEGYE